MTTENKENNIIAAEKRINEIKTILIRKNAELQDLSKRVPIPKLIKYHADIMNYMQITKEIITLQIEKEDEQYALKKYKEKL